MTSIAERLHRELLKQKKRLALAESCTGGAMGAALTRWPGASEFFEGSIVAYCNAWKERFLGVSPTTLKRHGAVSLLVVEEMVKGLFAKTNCDLAAAVSGIAGPSGGSVEKPVGTICLAVGWRDEPINTQWIYGTEDRLKNIELALETTFKILLEKLKQ